MHNYNAGQASDCLEVQYKRNRTYRLTPNTVLYQGSQNRLLFLCKERSMDMFESKKRFKELEKRIADLERQVQGQQYITANNVTLSGKVVMSIKSD